MRKVNTDKAEKTSHLHPGIETEVEDHLTVKETIVTRGLIKETRQESCQERWIEARVNLGPQEEEDRHCRTQIKVGGETRDRVHGQDHQKRLQKKVGQRNTLATNQKLAKMQQ